MYHRIDVCLKKSYAIQHITIRFYKERNTIYNISHFARKFKFTKCLNSVLSFEMHYSSITSTSNTVKVAKDCLLLP